jgi:N-acetylglucosaminyldiphosphoundecaprenol N-acetyl-beta-D-mannosaminyltransferase
MFGSRERQKERLLRAKSKSILVVGSRTKRVKSLERLLAEHPCQVEVASNAKDVFNRNKEEDVDFVIMTESLNHKVDEDLFARVRVLFPRAKFLVLVDRITREMEVSMRSKGLVFLGSYRRFVQFYQEIIGLRKDMERKRT